MISSGYDQASLREARLGGRACTRRTLSRMSGSAVPPIRETLEHRSGEEMELNDRFLNPQLGRILRTLGFDKVWRGGEGAHLIDDQGERYLDPFGGYGVLAGGRHHPQGRAALQELRAAPPGHPPHRGVTRLRAAASR